jgi:hypothetical protein
LTVWHDLRAGGLDVYGQRTSGLGALLPPGNFALAATPGNEQNPAVAYGSAADTYFVAWEKDTNIQGRAYVAP